MLECWNHIDRVIDVEVVEDARVLTIDEDLVLLGVSAVHGIQKARDDVANDWSVNMSRCSHISQNMSGSSHC